MTFVTALVNELPIRGYRGLSNTGCLIKLIAGPIFHEGWKSYTENIKFRYISANAGKINKLKLVKIERCLAIVEVTTWMTSFHENSFILIN